MKQESTNFLTTRQLARMWHVSEATVKRWADAGRLHPSRTLGGHRRFALKEVLRFQNEQGLDVSRIALTGQATAQQKSVGLDEHAAAEQFFDAIMRGQEGASAGVLLSSYMNGQPLVKILEDTFTAAMHRLGNLWHCGEVTVADEHLATQTARRAVETLRECIRSEGTDRGRAVVCTVEEEMHELAVLCLQLLLEERGWSVHYLGAHTPFYSMTDAMEKQKPQLICISSTSNLALSRNAREYDQFRADAEKRGVTIALGGEGFRDEAIRRRFPAHLHADNFRDLLNFLQE